MNKYRPDRRKCFVWCVLLVASRFSYAAQTMPEHDALVAAPVQWPEIRHVEEWLAQELHGESRTNASPTASSRARTPARSSDRLPTPGVELVGLYGVGGTLVADVRIGSRVHTLSAAPGGQRANRTRDKGPILAEAIEGTCLRMRYRATQHTVCLNGDARKGGADAYR